jgi:hypothetical protein
MEEMVVRKMVNAAQINLSGGVTISICAGNARKVRVGYFGSRSSVLNPGRVKNHWSRVEGWSWRE